MKKGPETSDVSLQDFRFLVLKGGGAKGFIHLGVAMALKELGILDNIDMVAGSSSGAIGALLLATGWSLEKLQNELQGLDFKELVGSENFLYSLLRFVKIMGLHQADGLYNWFKKIIKEVTGDENATFLDWHKCVIKDGSKVKDLYIEACNLNTGLNEEFSHTSPHKNVPIADALRASVAFPGYISPWEINGIKYSDGGLQKNCPVMLFEKIIGHPNPQMLAVWIDSLDKLHFIKHNTPLEHHQVNSIPQLIKAFGRALHNQQLITLARSSYKDRMIYCDTLGIDTLDVNLTQEKIELLIQSGIYGVIRYFAKYHPEIAVQYFNPAIIELIRELKYPLSIVEFKALSRKKIEQEDLLSSDSDSELESDLEVPTEHNLPTFESSSDSEESIGSEEDCLLGTGYFQMFTSMMNCLCVDDSDEESLESATKPRSRCMLI